MFYENSEFLYSVCCRHRNAPDCRLHPATNRTVYPSAHGDTYRNSRGGQHQTDEYKPWQGPDRCKRDDTVLFYNRHPRERDEYLLRRNELLSFLAGFLGGHSFGFATA
jgi:hypothetical protein